MGTHMSLDGATFQVTPVHGLALPPTLPGRGYEPQFNGNGQYKLKLPGSGKVTGVTRASTVAKTLEDTWMLDAWAKRMMLLGVQRSLPLQADLEQLITEHLADGGDPYGPTIARELRTELNKMSEEAQHRAGSTLAAEFGTAVHAWCEWVDHGAGHLSAVPEMFRPWVAGHRRALAMAGLTVDPYWTERIVLNTRYGIAGTLDRIFVDGSGNLVLGDIKTSKGMDYSWLYFAIQLAIYHSADYMLSLDGMAWEPVPALNPDVALISHIPREDPDSAHIVPIYMGFGHEALHTAMTVRRLRSHAEKRAQDVPYGIDSESREERRRREARFEIETAQTNSDLEQIWDAFQDVWTDDLTQLGLRSVELATANANA